MHSTSGKLDVLLVQRADASNYPPTINQANILASHGLRVGLLDGCRLSHTLSALSHNVELHRPFCQYQNGGNILFVKALRQILQDNEPAVCVAFDVAATTALGLIPFKGKKIFHYHEYPGNYFGSVSLHFRIQNWLSIYLSKMCDLIVMPDSHRSSAYYVEHCTHNLPLVVRNCPMRLDKDLQSGRLKKLLKQRGILYKWIVIYQGSVSSDAYSDEIIASMSFWPDETVMIFIGPITTEERKKIENNALNIGILNRVILLDPVPYEDLFSYTVDADIALTMYKPLSFNCIHTAGASNKRYDAMTCGVPQISNIGPGMKELIEDNGVGICIDPNDCVNLGTAIAELLVDSERRRLMSVSARKLHLNRFNYQLEYAPALSLIKQWCN